MPTDMVSYDNISFAVSLLPSSMTSRPLTCLLLDHQFQVNSEQIAVIALLAELLLMLSFAVKLHLLPQPAGSTFLKKAIEFDSSYGAPYTTLTPRYNCMLSLPLTRPFAICRRVQYIISLASGVSEIRAIVFTQLPQVGNHSALAPRTHRYSLIVFAGSISATMSRAWPIILRPAPDLSKYACLSSEYMPVPREAAGDT